MKKPGTRRKWLVVVLAAPLIVYGGVVLYFMHNERSFVYSPTHTMRPTAPRLEKDVRAVMFPSLDGTKLSARIVTAHPPARRWVYFLHGSLGNVSSSQGWWWVMHEAGANVFALDYRGYGESEGSPSESGIYKDALAGYQYLVRNMGVSPSDIVVYGFSLGTAPAIDVAGKEPVAGLILEGAFTSIPAVGQEMYPFLPVTLIAHNHFFALQEISAAHCPKLFLHSRNDEVIPIHFGRDLYNAASLPKRFVELKGTHNHALWDNQIEMVGVIKDFISRSTGGEQAAIRTK